MTKKLIMILGLVLSSMLMKAQAFFVPFPKAGDKYWQKQVPVAMRKTISDWAISIRRNLGMPFLLKLLPSSEPMVTAPDTRRLALVSENSLSVW